MTTCPREPNPGEKISASWMRELVRYVRSLRPIQGPGVRLDRKPEGTVIRAEASDGKSAAKVAGRFDVKIEVVEGTGDDADTATLTFSNRYYRCGGKTYEGSVETASALELPAIVALKVDLTGTTPSDQIARYADLSSLQTAEQNNDYYIMPLYKIDAHGGIECDFRLGPDAAQWEFPNA